MALLVLCEPRYRGTLWCDNKIRGIQDEATRRREKLKIFTDITAFEAAASKLGEDSSVIVLFDAIRYIQKIAPILARLSIHPMFSGPTNNIRLPFQYSCISPDMDYCGRTIVDYLQSCGKTRIAQIGISRDSWSDLSRAEAIARYVSAEKYRVFYINRDMEENYGEFLAAREDFDAVLCSTDHVAVSLIEYLKARGAYDPSLFLITYGDTIMARLYGEGITSFTVDYYACGKAAAKMHYDRVKYGWSAVTVLLKNEMIIRGSTAHAPYTPSLIPPQPIDVHPPTEQTPFRLATKEIGLLGHLLAACDIADLRLIYCMLAGYSYEKMADFCYLSVEAVKYRLRKFRDALDFASRAEATEFIRAYVQEDKLLSLIEEYEKRPTR